MLFTQKSEVDIRNVAAGAGLCGRRRAGAARPCPPGGARRACSPIVCSTVATHYVSAHAQNLELDIIEPMLTDAEAAVLRRGKNASKATVAKHATVQEYPRLHRL